MGFIDDGIIEAMKRALEKIASMDMSNTIMIVQNICSFTVSGSADVAVLSKTSYDFLKLMLMFMVLYTVYQMWFGEGLSKIKSEADNIYQTRKFPLAAVLGGPELYSAMSLWLTGIATAILAHTNILIIFRFEVMTIMPSPIATFVTAVLNIYLYFAAYVYQWVLTNGYFLFRPLGIFLLAYPRNGLANKAFRTIGYNMFWPVTVSLLVYSLDNTTRFGGALSALAWVAIPFFSYFAYKLLRFIYAYAWDPEKKKQWVRDTVKNAPARTAAYGKNKADAIYSTVLRKVGIHKGAPSAAPNATQPPAGVPQAKPEIESRK